MSNVVTMSGTRLLTPNEMLKEQSERDDIGSIVLLVTRNDGFVEVMYSRQQGIEIVAASKVLDVIASELARGMTSDE